MAIEFVLVAAVLTGIISSARLTRLVIHDDFPPSVRLRIIWDNLTDGSGWNKLLHCHWCFAAWVSLPILLWGYFSELHWSWWLFNGWTAGHYLASMLVERDEKD